MHSQIKKAAQLEDDSTTPALYHRDMQFVKQKVKMLNRTCVRCGKKWNVSIKTKASENNYVCPYCVSEERRANKYGIRYLPHKKALKVIESRKHRGSFYTVEGQTYIGIDNTTGDAWTEEFKDFNHCIEWLA